MSKSSKKKPANAPGTVDTKAAEGKSGSAANQALKGAGTGPTDAGRASAKVGGKGASATKGR